MIKAFNKRDQDIVRLYLEGRTLQQLSKRYLVSHERIRQILIDNDIELRKPGPVAVKIRPAFGKLTTKERLLRSVKVVQDAASGEHWIWPDRTGGYGRFVIKGRIYYAHRASFYITYGRFPKSRLRKKCLLDRCVHPNHWKEGAST